MMYHYVMRRILSFMNRFHLGLTDVGNVCMIQHVHCMKDVIVIGLQDTMEE